MKKLLIFTMVSLLSLTIGCVGETGDGSGSGDELDLQRENEIDQSDIDSDGKEVLP